MTGIIADYCGEIFTPHESVPFTIGREADLVIDEDNAFLHRQFLSIIRSHGLWWLCNVGSQLTATVSHDDGRVQAWLAPGAMMPLVFAETAVWFTAGSTTYEFDIRQDDALLVPVDSQPEIDGSTTIGQVTLTPDQKLLILGLAEDVLRRGDRGAGSVPQSAVAAARLGWPVTKFNRKLDNVCHKLADLGVRGLHGGPTRLASSRKARLVEYAVAARIVTAEDLDLLPPQP
ncbi:MAG: hypothetical protein ACK5LS_05575 [Propioniciclava sp.]